jgi:hypothetical protein
MKKSITTANHSPKGRNTTAVTKAGVKQPNRMYTHGKKIADRIMNILNYQYKESDLQFIL